jgi:hypothetical protein
MEPLSVLLMVIKLILEGAGIVAVIMLIYALLAPRKRTRGVKRTMAW